MPDLSAVDAELAELGAPAHDVAELVRRYGLDDRSPSRVDEALEALAQGVVAASPPPRPASVPRLQDTVVEQAAAPPPAPPAFSVATSSPVAPAPHPPSGAAVDAELDDFLADAGQADRALSQPPGGGSDFDTEEDDAWLDEQPTQAVEAIQDDEEPYDGMVAPPTELQASASEPPKRSSSYKELLRQNLDPADFPQTSHPPPPVPPAAAAAATDAGDDDFELLVDDADIIEIDDEELELIEDDD